MNPNLRPAVHLAVMFHHGQTDKSGEPYITHPLRVMKSLKDWSTRWDGISLSALQAAVLHDVIEDTEATPEILRMLDIPVWAIEVVEALTRAEDVTYPDFIAAISSHSNPDCALVKAADILDNLDPRRALPGEQGERLSRRYWAGLDLLIEEHSRVRDFYEWRTGRWVK